MCVLCAQARHSAKSASNYLSIFLSMLLYSLRALRVLRGEYSVFALTTQDCAGTVDRKAEPKAYLKKAFRTAAQSS